MYVCMCSVCSLPRVFFINFLFVQILFWSLKLYVQKTFSDFYRAVVVCLSIRPSVCLSQAGIVSKPLNIESRKQRHTTAQSSFLMPKMSAKFDFRGRRLFDK